MEKFGVHSAVSQGQPLSLPHYSVLQQIFCIEISVREYDHNIYSSNFCSSILILMLI